MVFMKMAINIVIYIFAWSHAVGAIEEYHFINWTKEIGKGSSKKEHLIKYLGREGYEVAECDLLVDICDVNCCEDKDCTESQKSAFQCPKITQKNDDVCTTVFRESQLFDCVRINSPYIGEFYENNRRLEKVAAVQRISLQKKKQGHFDYAQDLQTPITTEKYVYGQPLRTIFVTPNGLSEKHSELKLPLNVLSFIRGYCVDSPVLFLVNRDSYCVRQISEAECENSPVLQLGTYMMFDEQTNASLQYVLPRVLSNSSGSSPFKFYVKYMCVKNGNSYITVLNSDTEKVVNRNSMEDEDSPFECGEVGDIVTSHFDNKSGICHNVLVELFYNFFWNGTDILRVEAKYILADIPTRFESNGEKPLRNNQNCWLDKKLFNVKCSNKTYGYVKQKFSIKFIHSDSVIVYDNETFSETFPTVLKRSGKDGYNFDNPVFIIAKVENSSAAFEENVLQLWKTGITEVSNM